MSASRSLRVRRADVEEALTMNIGIVCYASVGGSGIIATELGKVLAARGHGVHILSSDTPVRLGDYQPACRFTASRRRAIRCSASRSICCRWPTRSCRCRATSSSTSSTRTTRSRTRPPHTWRGRFWRRRAAAACRASSRRCTAPTSRCSAATARIRRPWRSASSSRTASPPCPRA